ncbi:dsba oxidoreductase [Pseudomonas luteola]|uniref:Dsba oxidoreductase n=1 Tax=Pseudomonas luteola TaxID=47886 RepID=A0A2X2CRB9_PSELU|nr:thioredoxin domain-containing protein [Pseudomonas luteola]SPZ02575.1 dsba oxidoreductase [Pseudomonas luteola]
MRSRWLLGIVSFLLANSGFAATGSAAWELGPTQARYSITLYGDLECPFCKDYFPQISKWIASQSDVNLRWQHLPLSAHEPMASREAQYAECAGKLGGNQSFWKATQMIYAQTQGNGSGIPKGLPVIADIDHSAMRECMADENIQSEIQKQVLAAQRKGINATPSLVVTDHKTERDVLLTGPADENVLLSALDALAVTDATQMFK